MGHHKLAIFDNLRGKVSHKALDLLVEEKDKIRVMRDSNMTCGHQIWTSYKKIPLSDIDIFWTKLNTANPTLLEEEEIDVIGKMCLVTEEINSKSPEIKKSLIKKAQKQKEEDVVKDNLAYQESTFEPLRHSSFTAVIKKSQKPVFGRSRSTSVSKAIPPSDSQSQNEFCFPRNMKPDGLNNVYRFGRHILPIIQPYVINIQDVEPDGNCGFRSVAVGLGFDENHWAFIRQQLLHELDFNTDLYKYVFNSNDPGSYDVLRNTINWQEIAPAPAEHWMFMPHTGLVIAQRFGVIVHLFSNRGPQTIFLLWTSANSLMRHNVVSVVHLGVHFINVTLQGDYTMPTVNPIWKRYRNDAASDWEFVYHDRSG
ncbi:hypothetical protein E3N88_39073 [Mikania micrantha]|uniref:OTU domain-containing protein n=1 Tax=Mikania micrantha TaxID=192012 RepID=A0A5N6LVS2_9ASTR|nr:hypothetical protein E3N88_39073 [Mikania micrantha]